MTVPRPRAATTASVRRARAGDGAGTVAGIKLSHPEKLLFPEKGLTKRDIAQYYALVGPRMLPYIEGRPLSLVRCPEGWSGTCFYQKHADKSVNAAVTRVEVPEAGGTATYMSANTIEAIVALVQWGVAEFHVWGARVPRLDRPDQLVLDLDPADDVEWAALKDGVLRVRRLLDDMGITAFLKTTGGKGLHVVIPIRATLEWSQAKGFTRAIAERLVGEAPQGFVATADKESRRGRVYIDYLRNAQGATAVAPYSVRARENAPIAMPLAWDELRRDPRFDAWNAADARTRLARRADPWADFLATRQPITAAMARHVGFTLGKAAARGG